jgi:hypothetical protein
VDEFVDRRGSYLYLRTYSRFFIACQVRHDAKCTSYSDRSSADRETAHGGEVASFHVGQLGGET